MKSMFFIKLSCILIVIPSCKKEESSACKKKENHINCSLIPEVGPCNAAFPKYYFDQNEQKCKLFTWGGCNGVVPFDSLEECNKKCPCQGN